MSGVAGLEKAAFDGGSQSGNSGLMLQRYKPRLVARRLSQGDRTATLRPPSLLEGVKQPQTKAPRPRPYGPLSLPVEAAPVRAADPVLSPVSRSVHNSERDAQIARLRAALSALESGAEHEVQAGLSLGDIDPHLPGRGLPVGVLNEVTAAYAHRPAAFGFTFALMALGQKRRPGPVILVMSRRALRDFGHPFGHGLAQLGLHVGDLILVEADKDIDALWGIEEALRARGSVALVAGAITAPSI